MSRRASGEGSILKRADGRWSAYVTVPSGGRRYFYGQTQQEVLRKLTEARRVLASGLPLPTDRLTVGAYLRDWLIAVKRTLKPRTWVRYEQYVRVHAVPVIGAIPLARLQPSHLDRLYQRRLDAGMSPTSVHHLHMVLHAALATAGRRGLVARNVAQLVDPPRMARRDMSVLSPAQARALVEAARGGPLEALLTTALATGMRKGELLALRWRDVDLDRGTLAVTGTLQRTAAGLVISETKTAKSRRQVELSAVAVQALRRHRAAQTERRLLAGREWNDHGLVFPSTLGKPQDGSHLLYGQFHPLLKAAGLPVIRFHDLRHTAATLMLGRGVHPKIVSEMLGHATVAITLDLYSHVTPTMQRQAAQVLDDLLAD